MSKQQINSEIILKAVEKFQTPFYLYDESIIIQKCKEVMSMPNAFGLVVKYAMKANSNKALLQLITKQGFGIDASSLNEVKRAYLAGIDYNKIMLTTQEVPTGDARRELEDMIKQGLKYNVCSLRQLELIADFASENNIKLSIRVHPGVGSGESQTRNTGDKYSCFGTHITDIESALILAKNKNITFDQIHVHIGSGGDPVKWKENIDKELEFIEKYFPDVVKVNFGGGLKEARMPDEISANIQEMGLYAEQKIKNFYDKTGRKLIMEIEPGTYIMANSGYLVTEVIDKKQTGQDGFNFLILNAGMEANSRPLLYGSKHPFYVVSKKGILLSAEDDLDHLDSDKNLHVVVGRCCESGDSQSLDSTGNIVSRIMAKPEIGDYIIIGGCGAYCSSMTPFNYNSHTQIPEILLKENNKLQLIRRSQTLYQIVENEIRLE